ncbi:sugar transferase [Roseovarius sp. SCSIO 43702]|uniref:sugar transferase n=1 Tax=Roseovarius sp. SCSIO 43702 TaxID=2823043 RepID=UPI001C72C04D|nr:sugar transferase [Roseovarius sp. SCSIO 43702]QYX56964.1 sugar transferase [Roseovarius sp. SCSIO 43702]
MQVELGHVWSIRHSPVDAKRLVDLCLVVLSLPVVLSVLLVILPLVTILDGYSPLHSQMRVGRGGVPFRLWKIRTMRPGAAQTLNEILRRDPAQAREWRETRKLARDPRVTRIGWWLRRYRVDEIPQIWNILRGEMSVVGPRPVMAEELRLHYGGAGRRSYKSVRPGLTGLWQVTVAGSGGYEPRVALDRAYVANRSLGLDLWIVLRTVAVVVGGKGL